MEVTLKDSAPSLPAGAPSPLAPALLPRNQAFGRPALETFPATCPLALIAWPSELVLPINELRFVYCPAASTYALFEPSVSVSVIAIAPESLMPFACPPTAPAGVRSAMPLLVQRNGRGMLLPPVVQPTTCPAALMPVALPIAPPNVPRSCIDAVAGL